MHEKNVQNTVHVEKVDTILSDVENVPFALRGATVKTILYWLFSVIAAAELSAAFFFYISSFEMPQVAAAVISVVIALARLAYHRAIGLRYECQRATRVGQQPSQ